MEQGVCSRLTACRSAGRREKESPKNGPTFLDGTVSLCHGTLSARSKFTMWIGLHRRRRSAAIQTLLRLGEADAAARFDVGVTLREFALVGGILGAQQVLQLSHRLQQLIMRELFNLRLNLGEEHAIEIALHSIRCEPGLTHGQTLLGEFAKPQPDSLSILFWSQNTSRPEVSTMPISAVVESKTNKSRPNPLGSTTEPGSSTRRHAIRRCAPLIASPRPVPPLFP